MKNISENKEGDLKNQQNDLLLRFVEAQEYMYNLALEEVRNGKKRSHWIWYIFPQLKGLGFSYSSMYYGIDGVEEAKAYLKHPVLGNRLREITTALLELESLDVIDIFGRTDAMKVRSCMTLFNNVSDDDLFKRILDKYYNGECCRKTEFTCRDIVL
jgi:uncharacterized protein (DUF1810 family)